MKEVGEVSSSRMLPRFAVVATAGRVTGLLFTAMLLVCACQTGIPAGSEQAATSASEQSGASQTGVSVESDRAAGAASSQAGGIRAAESQATSQQLDIEVEPLYRPWARVLSMFVDAEGLVDYAGLSTEGRADLEEFMRGLANADPAAMPGGDARIAFWINAYNATVLWQVIEAYPLESVRDVGALWGLVGGFFKSENLIAGANRSLDDIEHGILRTDYEDARIHWALVCGAFGCPRLLQRPYLAADLDSVLTEQAFEFVSQERGLRLDRENGVLHLSSYFDWYAEDFEAESGSVIDYLLRYAEADVAARLRANRRSLTIRFMDYDWTLNDQAKGPR